jgi:hypothetical protein
MSVNPVIAIDPSTTTSTRRIAAAVIPMEIQDKFVVTFIGVFLFSFLLKRRR